MCVEVTLPTVEPLSGGLSLAPPPLPAFSGDLNLCCKIVSFDVPLPPIPLPPLVFSGAVGLAIGTALAVVQGFLDSLPPDCPLQ